MEGGDGSPHWGHLARGAARRGWGELMKFVLLDVAYHEERRATGEVPWKDHTVIKCELGKTNQTLHQERISAYENKPELGQAGAQDAQKRARLSGIK